MKGSSQSAHSRLHRGTASLRCSLAAADPVEGVWVQDLKEPAARELRNTKTLSSTLTPQELPG